MKTRYFLLFSNLLTLVLLIALFVKERYPQRAVKYLSSSQSKSEYYVQSNLMYQRQTDFYQYYRKKGAVVMLGNSITYQIDWNELLGRDDILNRGIPSDVTAGFLRRLESVVNAEPKLCFIMGGINDLYRGIEQDTILSNLTKISLKLKDHGITPVFQSVFYVNQKFPNSINLNNKVKQLNQAVEGWCMDNQLKYIDLNQLLGLDGILRDSFAAPDGIHLSGLAYTRWGSVLVKEISGLLEEH